MTTDKTHMQFLNKTEIFRYSSANCYEKVFIASVLILLNVLSCTSDV